MRSRIRISPFLSACLPARLSTRLSRQTSLYLADGSSMRVGHNHGPLPSPLHRLTDSNARCLPPSRALVFSPSLPWPPGVIIEWPPPSSPSAESPSGQSLSPARHYCHRHRPRCPHRNGLHSFMHSFNAAWERGRWMMGDGMYITRPRNQLGIASV